jgi:hypothetical protein
MGAWISLSRYWFLKFAVQRQSFDNEKLAAFRQYGIDAMARISSPLPYPGPMLKLPTPSNMKQATAENIAQHLLSQDPDDLRKAKGQGTAHFFADLCDVLKLDRTGIDLQRRSAKAALFDLITNSVRARLSTVGLSLYLPPRRSKTMRACKEH